MSKTKDIKSTKKLPICIRSAVWNTFIGQEKGVAQCYTGCGSIITQNNFQVGHIISRHHGGTDKISNLKPICQQCNTSMGTRNMYEFMEEFGLTSPYDNSKISQLNSIQQSASFYNPFKNVDNPSGMTVSTSPTLLDIYPSLYTILKL